jgi:hypothetical protein
MRIENHYGGDPETTCYYYIFHSEQTRQDGKDPIWNGQLAVADEANRANSYIQLKGVFTDAIDC